MRRGGAELAALRITTLRTLGNTAAASLPLLLSRSSCGMARRPGSLTQVAFSSAEWEWRAGHTYDRLCIERWLAAGNRTCPVTGMRLRHLELTPNFALRNAIQVRPACAARAPPLSGCATCCAHQCTTPSPCSGPHMCADVQLPGPVLAWPSHGHGLDALQGRR